MFSKFCCILLLIICKVQGHYIKNSTTEECNSEKAVSALIFRLIGEKSRLFQVFINATLKEANGKDEFRIIKAKTSNQVQIYGTSGVAASWGFHYYLKEYCNCHISWDGDQINLPSDLPSVDIRVTANDKYRFYQNVVTTSYSYTWWNWTRWQREIDWMALNGINLALAFNGQEEIWRRTFFRFGLNDGDVDLYFTGPSFLSWNRMGNLRDWGGPLTKNWHKFSVTLQKLILTRMRSLGIIPVLPAFAGFVPRAFKRIYPTSSVNVVRWLAFQDQYCCLYILSPTDKMFEEIGTAFLTEYIKEYGTDHVYSCDSYNELTPPHSDVQYLKLIGRSVFNAMTKVDNDAIWVMQGWLFHNEATFWTEERAEALLTSVPQGRMLVLDLHAELYPQYLRLKSFFGQPFIWCMLHNFGGTLGLQARTFANSTMIGTGITPEGINQNYVVYDLMTEMAWRKTPVNLTQWIENYAKRRYGFFDINISSAWILLLNSVYNYTGPSQHGNYIFVLRPSFKLTENVWYHKEDIWKAWDHMVQAAQQHLKHLTSTFLYDLVDITRQSLQLCTDSAYQQITSAFKNRNKRIFKTISDKFLDILVDMDKILATEPMLLLGKWISDAKSLGVTPLEKHLYERNIRNQITLWGPYGEISDYANKQWSGLIMDYYSARWKLFLFSAYQSLKNQSYFDEFKVGVRIFKEIEQPFTYSTKKYPETSTGDPVQLALEFNRKWRLKC
ncbi:N-acetyl-alpha-glucosaminidase isoform X2 [Rhodnius prolixus]|uniref:N-acetyl-alpha-glucosaminidase isoform X2 n=1 Tax=Rhodnius prolixus TaxID=13249 RepID=UPI003D189227